MKTDKSPVDKKIRNDSSDVQTSKRIREHLTNKNDVISAEDITNAKTDISVHTDNLPDNEPDVETPWDILEL